MIFKWFHHRLFFWLIWSKSNGWGLENRAFGRQGRISGLSKGSLVQPPWPLLFQQTYIVDWGLEQTWTWAEPFWHLLGHLFGKYGGIIGLKAPGNYCASFWSNEISVLFCEGPKPLNSTVSFFLVGEPSFMDFNIPNYFEQSKKYGHRFEHIMFVDLKFGESLFSIFVE